MILLYVFFTIVNVLLLIFPGNEEIMFWSQLGILANLGIFVYFKHKLGMSNKDYFGNLAVLFMYIMTVYIVIGSFAHALLATRYPGLLSRNYIGGHRYMVQCLLIYVLTLLLLGNPKIKRKYYHYHYIRGSRQLYTWLMLIGLFATLVVIIRIGFVPILSKTYADDRFLQGMGSILSRSWTYLIYPFTYFTYQYTFSRDKKSVKNIILATLCFVPMLLFNIRYLATLAIVIILLMLLNKMPDKIRAKYILSSAVILIMFIQIPSFILTKRDDYSVKYEYVVTGRVLTDRFMNLLVIDSFSGNYVQTIDLITRYSDYRYGETLWSLVILIFPRQILYAVGIDKSAVQKDNSAYILAEMTEGSRSGGLRTGIMGELYVNFGVFGSIFMSIWAAVLHLISKASKVMHLDDFRAVLFYPVYATMVYSIIGQPDAIASMVYNTLLVGFFLYLFSVRKQVNEIKLCQISN